jgi:alcohol dehydrogenase
MRAAVLREYGQPLAIESIDPPTVSPDGAVVDVRACGVCRSDWHAWQGHGEWNDDRVELGQVLGHEPAGHVLEVGDRVDGLSPGDRVAIPFCLGDGTCHACRNGHGNVCENGWALGFEHSAQGAFAEQIHVPNAEYNAIALPEDVSFDEVAALGCRYATAYHALAHRSDLSGGDWVVVHGCGGVGLAAVEVWALWRQSTRAHTRTSLRRSARPSLTAGGVHTSRSTRWVVPKPATTASGASGHGAPTSRSG